MVAAQPPYGFSRRARKSPWDYNPWAVHPRLDVHADTVAGGKGGHAASPHLTIDPIVCATHMITAFQTIASRNVNPLDSAVVFQVTSCSETRFRSPVSTPLVMPPLR